MTIPITLMTGRPGTRQYLWKPVATVTDDESYFAWLKDHDGKGDKYSRPFLPASLLQPEPGTTGYRRLNTNLGLRYVLTLDADKADAGFAAKVREVLEPLGIGAVLHTTASHKADKPRWRVHVVLSRGATPEEYLSIATYLIERIGFRYFDKQASTSPAHVVYAPATPGVEWVEIDGKPLDVDDWMLMVPLVPWTVTDSIGAITIDEWRSAHPVTRTPDCTYGRSALRGEVDRLEGMPEGEGVHTRGIFHAARRAVELVGAGCWDLDDVDRLADVALGMRKKQRSEEWPEALASALKKGDQAVTDCGRHSTTAADEFGEYLAPVDDEEATSIFETFDFVAVLDPNRPPRPFFLEGFIPAGDQCSIVAPGGTGKSLLLLGLCLAAVSGQATFLGRRLACPGRIFYVDMENSEEDWAERLRAYGWTQESAATLVGRFLPLSLPPLAGLDTKRGADQLKGWLRSHGAGEGDSLVLDSTQRLTEGEENSNDTMRRLYDLTATWLKSKKITVIRTDNTGKDEDKGARGASNKRDDVGYELILKSVGDKTKGRFSLTSTKHRSAGDGGRLVFDRTLDTATGHLAWVPVAAEEAVTDFDDLPAGYDELVLAAWMLTEPSSGPNYQDDWVSQTQLTGLATGNAGVKRTRLEDLVTKGFIRKENLLVGDPTKGIKAKHPSFGLSEKGREWIEEKGTEWVANRRVRLAQRLEKTQ
jgi:hypothetical protein